jgi:hypothetical protein
MARQIIEETSNGKIKFCVGGFNAGVSLIYLKLIKKLKVKLGENLQKKIK